MHDAIYVDRISQWVLDKESFCQDDSLPSPAYESRGRRGEAAAVEINLDRSQDLRAGAGENQICAEAEDEARKHADRRELFVPDPSAGARHLADDPHDRAGRERQECDRQDRRCEPIDDDGAEERRRTTDEAEPEYLPEAGGRTTRKRRRYPEAFGHVVQTESDDEHDRELDGSRRRRLADPESFTEVV